MAVGFHRLVNIVCVDHGTSLNHIGFQQELKIKRIHSNVDHIQPDKNQLRAFGELTYLRGAVSMSWHRVIDVFSGTLVQDAWLLAQEAFCFAF